MLAATTIFFRGKSLKSVTVGTKQYWPMRDLGVLLGYDSRGGNLSRQVNNGFCDSLRMRRDYIIQKRPGKKGGQPMFLLTLKGVSRTLKLIIKNDKKRAASTAMFEAIVWAPLLPAVIPEKKRIEQLEDRVARLENAMFLMLGTQTSFASKLKEAKQVMS